MTTSQLDNNGHTPFVRCPICLDVFRWDGITLYELIDDNYYPLDISGITDPVKKEKKRRNTYVQCPDSSNEISKDHFLPLDYLRYREPLVIGLVGAKDAGKTTLLTAMINEMERSGLYSHEFTIEPLIREQHEKFRSANIERLLDDGKTVHATLPARETVQFADALLLIRETDVQPVVFFDVSGESLTENISGARFLQAVSALIFVVDPEYAMGRATGSIGADGRPRGDRAFKTVLDNLIAPSGVRTQRLEIPAAIALAKADILRFEQPVAKWLFRPGDASTQVDAQRIRAESRDIYAFLYQHDAGPWLEPFNKFVRCTLHAVSATGTSAKGDEYQRPLRSRRVLEPLISILAMTGVINGAEARQVGR